MDFASFFQFSLFLMAVMMSSLKPILAQPRAFFVFGDSLVDNGNNNYLATSARADTPPYGIDSASHQPSGRFSNGKNIPDIISEKIGSEPVLPILSPMLTGARLLVGANFASAGVGILNDTGFQFVNILRMYQQLDYFEKYQRRLSALVGEVEAREVVKRSLTLITVGGNDFVNNYYLVPLSLRSTQYTIPEYVPYLIAEYRKILERLYSLGVRRVLVTGTGPIGCAPAELAQHSQNGECYGEMMKAADIFNPQLEQMLQQLNANIGSDVFITINTQRMHIDFISDPEAFGFETAQVACCGQGRFNGIGLCTPLSNLCPNRDTYAFWDAFHPSERANRLIVENILTGTLEYMKPMNLSTILDLDSRV